MRYRGLAGERFSSLFWPALLLLHGAGVVCTFLFVYNIYGENRKVEEDKRCSSASVSVNLILAFSGPSLLYILFYFLTGANKEPAVADATESSLRKGISSFQAEDVPCTWKLKLFSVSSQNEFIRHFQSDEKKRREQLLERFGEPPETIGAEHIKRVIREADRLLMSLLYDGENLLRPDPGRFWLFAIANLLGSIISLDLAYSTTEKCGMRFVLGQYLQFISVTTVLFLTLSTFVGYGTYESLIYHKLSQSDLQELAEVISLYVANTGKKIHGIRSNSNSSYADEDDQDGYDVYVPVISRHVVMRNLKVRGNDTVREAHENGVVVQELYLIGGAADDN